MSERKTKVVVKSLDGTAPMTRVKIQRGDVEIEVDNLLSVDVRPDGRCVLTFSGAEYHGSGTGCNVGVDTRPEPLIMHPAPTRQEWLDW